MRTIGREFVSGRKVEGLKGLSRVLTDGFEGERLLPVVNRITKAAGPEGKSQLQVKLLSVLVP